MNNTTEAKAIDGMAVVLTISILIIGFGAVMLLNPDLSLGFFTSLLGFLMIVYGLIKIAFYWVKGEYRNVSNYDFSIGLITATLGAVVLVNKDRIAANGVWFLGLLILVLAVINIQYALQIRVMDGKLFPVVLIFAIATYIIAMLALTGPGGIFEKNLKLFYELMIASGVMGIISMALVAIRSRNLAKEEEKAKEDMFTVEPTSITDVSEEPVGIETNPDNPQL